MGLMGLWVDGSWSWVDGRGSNRVMGLMGLFVIVGGSS